MCRRRTRTSWCSRSETRSAWPWRAMLQTSGPRRKRAPTGNNSWKSPVTVEPAEAGGLTRRGRSVVSGGWSDAPNVLQAAPAPGDRIQAADVSSAETRSGPRRHRRTPGRRSPDRSTTQLGSAPAGGRAAGPPAQPAFPPAAGHASRPSRPWQPPPRRASAARASAARTGLSSWTQYNGKHLYPWNTHYR